MSLSFLWKWIKRSLTIVEIWVSPWPDFLVMRSTSWYRNDSSIIQILYSIKRFTCRSSYGDLKYFALVKLSGAYVPSLFQHLLNHTSISGEGPNWHNILFKFNVSCKIDYYAKDPMSICIRTKECWCRIFFWFSPLILANFSHLRLNRKQRNFAYVFVVKKAEDK